MDDEKQPNPPKRLIKKYENRRLYDTAQSRYITLAELAEIVRAGAEVEVVDAKSGKDLTRQVLTQVILDQQERLNMIPVSLLHFIIRSQGTLEQEPFSSFLALVTEQFRSSGKLWGDQMKQMFGSLPGFSRPAAASPAAGERAATGGGAEPNIDSLRSRMDALLKSMSGEG